MVPLYLQLGSRYRDLEAIRVFLWNLEGEVLTYEMISIREVVAVVEEIHYAMRAQRNELRSMTPEEILTTLRHILLFAAFICIL